ncbi:tetratricopeptide repeat protein, partial [Corallococcus aberystwythensis]
PEPLGASRPIERPPTASPSPDARRTLIPEAPLSLVDYQDRIQSLMQRGALHEALELGNQCATRLPREGECELMLGMLYARLNDNRTSVAHYQRFLEYAPSTHPSRPTVVRILDEANAPSSASGRQVKPETFADMMEAGNTAVRAEKFPEAVAAYRNALAMKPDSLGTKLELGLALLKLQPGTPADHKEAVKLLENVTWKKSGIRRAWMGLEVAYTLTGNKAKAERAHERAMLMSPRNATNPARAQEMIKKLTP